MTFPTAIDLFCGSGAVTKGLRLAGFRVLASVDCDPIACATYRLNHPKVKLLEEDIKNVRASKLKKQLKLRRRIDLLAVCAPCQPFSSQNRKRDDDDERTKLLLHSLKFIRVFRPKIVLFENVPGILRSPVLAVLQQKLANAGYHLSAPVIHDAADFGVPQRRQRVLMVASTRLSLIDDLELGPKVRRTITVRQAIGNLLRLKSGEAQESDVLHRSRNHTELVIDRLRHIPPNGGSRIALPIHLQLACHKNDDDDNAFSDVYGRMAWDDVAPTLTTGCTDVTRGRFAHPKDHRAITLREAARLQTFPDGYRFTGNDGQIACQIGNAVPVRMVRKIAERLYESIQSI